MLHFYSIIFHDDANCVRNELLRFFFIRCLIKKVNDDAF